MRIYYIDLVSCNHALLILINSFVDFLGFSKNHFVFKYSVTSSFPVLIPSIVFSFFIAQARTASSMSKRNGKSGHHCFIPNLTVKVRYFTIISLAVGLHRQPFSDRGNSHLLLVCRKFFIINIDFCKIFFYVC